MRVFGRVADSPCFAALNYNIHVEVDSAALGAECKVEMVPDTRPGAFSFMPSSQVLDR